MSKVPDRLGQVWIDTDVYMDMVWVVVSHPHLAGDRHVHTVLLVNTFADGSVSDVVTLAAFMETPSFLWEDNQFRRRLA